MLDKKGYLTYPEDESATYRISAYDGARGRDVGQSPSCEFAQVMADGLVEYLTFRSKPCEVTRIIVWKVNAKSGDVIDEIRRWELS